MRVLFNLLPCLVNIITGLFMFISAKRMADSGASSFMVGATMAVWAFFYASSAFVLGRFLTKRNAVKVLLAGQGILLIALLGLALMPSVTAQYFWLPGTGIGTAAFFTSFQVVVKLFGKEEYALESVSKNVAVYTLSWSFGIASGPMITMFVWGLFSPEEGWRYCYFITIGMVLFITICLFLMNGFVKRRLAELGEADGQTVAPDIPEEQKALPDLIIASWSMAIFSGCVVAMMRTHLPDYCTKVLHMETWKQSAVLAVISYAQAFAGLACWKARRWQYQPAVLGVAGVGGVIAMLIFSFSGNFHAYLLAAVMYLVVFVAVMVLAFILMAVVVLSTGGALSDVGAALAPDTSTLAGYFTFGAVVSQVFYALMQTVLVTIMTGVALDTYKAFVAHHGAGMD